MPGLVGGKKGRRADLTPRSMSDIRISINMSGGDMGGQ
jgi:hypothetical protein